MVSFIILCLDKIKILKYKEFQVTLVEMKDTETSVRNLAKAILEVSKTLDDKVAEFHDEDSERLNNNFQKSLYDLENLTK